MRINDLKTIGPTLGFSNTLDNHRSAIWNAGTATTNGTGFSNNRLLNTQATTGGGYDTQAVANTVLLWCFTI